MGTASLQTGRLATTLLAHGDAEGLPVLFLHGSYGSRRWWTLLFDLMPDDFYVVAPDLRGAACASPGDGGYEITEQARDVAAIVEALGWSDFDLVAHASAAAVAIDYVLGTADTVRSLTLISPPPLEGATTPIDGLMLLDRLRGDRTLLEQALRALTPVVAKKDPVTFISLLDDAAAQAPAAFTAHAEALGRWNRLGDARRLTLPTLLIWGDEDPIVGRDTMTRTLVAIPGAANLEVLRGVGHAPMLDAPLLLAEKIVGFITEDFDQAAAIRNRAAS